MNFVGLMVDIIGCMMFLVQDLDICIWLMIIYIVMMFLGGGVVSWVGIVVYDWGGWIVNVGLVVCFFFIVFGLVLWSYWEEKVVYSENE